MWASLLAMKNKISENIIFANGAKPKHPVAINALNKAKNIVCCDGGLSKLLELNVQPTAIVGDLDSITSEQLEQYQAIVSPDKCQDYNDLQKALRYAIANHFEDVTILAAHGLREDHFIANVSILISYFQQIKITMLTDNGIFTPVSNTSHFESFPTQKVSIFSFDPEVPITSKGLQYPLKELKLKQLWEGTLNMATEKQFSIICNNAKILIYQVFDNEKGNHSL